MNYLVLAIVGILGTIFLVLMDTIKHLKIQSLQKENEDLHEKLLTELEKFIDVRRQFSRASVVGTFTELILSEPSIEFRLGLRERLLELFDGMVAQSSFSPGQKREFEKVHRAIGEALGAGSEALYELPLRP